MKSESRWVIATAALIGFTCLLYQRLVDEDLFGHLYFGRAAVLAGHVLKTDPFAFTPHLPVWYNHEWLWETSTWILYSSLGDVGLLLLKGLAGAVMFSALAALGLRARSHPLCVLGLLTVVAVALRHDVHVRPYVATYTLYPVCLWLLSQVESRPRVAVPALWALFLVWANAHAAFVVGLGSVALYVAVALVQRQSIWKQYALAGVGGTVAACLNPYGLAYWPFVLSAVTMKRAYITEFRPVPWDLPVAHDPFLWYKVLLLGTLGLLVWNRRRPDVPWAGLLLLLITAKMSLSAYRHVPLFLLTVAAVWPALLPPMKPVAGRWPLAGALGAAVLWCGLELSAGMHLLVPTAAGPADFYTPYNAVRFMKANGLGGKVAVWFDWGEFVIWEMNSIEWHPDTPAGCQVSFDGRLETIYPETTIQENLAFLKDGDLSILDHYPPDVILLPADNAAAKRLYLERKQDWRLVFPTPQAFDSQGAVVFVPAREVRSSYLQPRPGLDPVLVPLSGPPSVH